MRTPSLQSLYLLALAAASLSRGALALPRGGRGAVAPDPDEAGTSNWLVEALMQPARSGGRRSGASRASSLDSGRRTPTASAYGGSPGRSSRGSNSPGGSSRWTDETWSPEPADPRAPRLHAPSGDSSWASSPSSSRRGRARSDSSVSTVSSPRSGSSSGRAWRYSDDSARSPVVSAPGSPARPPSPPAAQAPAPAPAPARASGRRASCLGLARCFGAGGRSSAEQ